MTFMTGLMEYKFVILFYMIIVAIIVIFKNKFTFQAKFIALYKTKVGIRLMHWFADKFGPFVRGMGYISIFIGYAGMMLIVWFLGEGLYNLIFIPDAPATLSPVIPGVPIPGSPIFVPFWYGITALFVVVAIHEFCHGVVSAAHKIKVESSGIVFFGPLIGAFVEPNEKQLVKKNWWVQESLFAAGPVSNGFLSLIVGLLLLFVIMPIGVDMVHPQGFYFEDVSADLPAQLAGVQPKIIYDNVNGVPVTNATYLQDLLEDLSPGDELTISNENLTHTMVLTDHPDIDGGAFMGVIGLQSNYVLNNPEDQWKFDAFTIIVKFLEWVFILSLGIGLANLLPLGPVDGGRMLLLSMQKIMDKEKALKIFSKLSAFLLSLIIILVFVPILKAIF